jgi:hypothetical protein
MQVRQATDTIRNVEDYINRKNSASTAKPVSNGFLARPEKTKDNVDPIAVELVLKVKEAFDA